MKSHKFHLFLFLILCFYGFIKCRNIIEKSIKEKNNNSILCNDNSPNLSLDPLKDNNIQINGLEINKTIEIGKIGKIQTEFLEGKYIYNFNFSNNNNLKSDLIVNLYPLDCKIIIEDIDNNGATIRKISNYEYDAFSIVIKEDKINTSFIRVKPLINPLEDKNNIRTYHLIINNFYVKAPELIFNENFPTLIYFDSNLENITLSYNLNDSEELKEPVVFSFFIKERAKFEAQILDSEIPNRIIAYKDNIVIDTKIISFTNNKISIFVNKKEDKNCTMIVKISGNNSPFYLQKNILNLGFMPINTSNHYYYMEIFKGEEGEIMLHNKIHNGYLLYNIINKNNMKESQILENHDYFPKYNYNENSTNNKYNDFSKKLNISSNETNCENGCYLLITYYSPKINMTNLVGIEYNLLVRIWDEEEFKSQIVNIPLNEYIFGAIEPMSSSINAHYYSIYIPENNDILFEFQGRNIQAFAKKGILQINYIKKPYNSLLLTEDIKDRGNDEKKLIIKLNESELGLDSFENQYLSFAFIVLDDDYSNNLINYYYFRIIQDPTKNIFTIYPLDTNKVNLCQTSKLDDSNYVCYFLLKNDYKELNNNFSIFAYGQEEANNYTGWPINETDYYSIDINNTKEIYSTKNKSRIKEGYLTVFFNESFNFNYFLLELHSKHEEILNMLINFNAELIYNNSLDIYSYQSFYLKTNRTKSFFLNVSSSNKYIFAINNTSGDGYICLNKICNKNETTIFISEKIFLSFVITETLTSIHFISEKNLFFNIKIKDKMVNHSVEELDYGSNFKNIDNKYNNSKFYFYIKNRYDNGVDIDFIFNITNYNNNINIFGIIIDYDDFKHFGNDNKLQNLLSYNEINNNYIKGKYDPFTKSGLITFDNIKSKNEFLQEDKYYLIVLYPQKSIQNFKVSIFIDFKRESQFNLQKKRYFRGSFNLFNNCSIQNKTFLVEIEGNSHSNDSIIYILEFSSNLEVIKPIFNNNFSYYNKTTYGGVQKYFISVNKSMTDKKLNFDLQLNNSIDKHILNNININNNNNEIGLYFGNYIINFYKKENEDNMDFIIEKDIYYKKINNTNENLFNYNFTIKKKKNNNAMNNKYNYAYFFRLYSKDSLYEPQNLNTIALVFYDKSKSYDNYCEFKTNNTNEDISCIFSNISDNKQYILSMFVKIINGKEENYLSNSFEIEINEKNKKKILILSLIGCSLFIIIIIITIFAFIFRNKKNLKEKVKNISFISEERTINDDKIGFIED